MSTNLPHSYPSCGVEGVREELAAMIAKAKCPCEKFERLLMAAQDYYLHPQSGSARSILRKVLYAIEEEAK